MRNNIASYYHTFMKLNQSLLNTIQLPSSSLDNNNNENLFNKILMHLNEYLFNKILMQLIEWLAFFPNLINSLIANFKDTFTNFFKTLSHWPAFFQNLINSLIAMFKDTFTNFFKTLSHWLAFFPILINSLFAKFKDTFTNSLETLALWLALAVPYLTAGAGIVAICSVLFFCVPVIVGCFAWLAAACCTVISSVFMLLWLIFSGSFTLWWAIFSGFFTLLWWIFRGFVKLLWTICGILFMLVSKMRGSLSGICSLCGRNSLKMMIAPGTARGVLIPRAVFESSPAAYFSNLRAGLKSA